MITKKQATILQRLARTMVDTEAVLFSRNVNGNATEVHVVERDAARISFDLYVESITDDSAQAKT